MADISENIPQLHHIKRIHIQHVTEDESLQFTSEFTKPASVGGGRNNEVRIHKLT